MDDSLLYEKQLHTRLDKGTQNMIFQALRLVLALSSLISLSTFADQVIVPYEYGGRFGDQIILYADAKWLSYKTGIPLAIHSFIHSEALALDTHEPKYRKNLFRNYQPVLIASKGQFLWKWDRQKDGSHKNNVMYQFRYQGMAGEYAVRLARYQADHDFMDILRKMVHPKHPLNLIKPKKAPNTINVAVHIRKGTPGRWEMSARQQNSFKLLPSGNILLPFDGKFLPDSYYIKQIRWFATRFPDKKINFYLFTDLEKPYILRDHYMTHLHDLSNIALHAKSYAYQNQNDVLTDFFSLLEFDNLIRSNSNFSIAAQLLGNYNVIIAPNVIGNGEKNSKKNYFLLPTASIIEKQTHMPLRS